MIWNNGKGIPVVEHKVEKVYVPALIFGQLLTSSNYDDDEKKVTGVYEFTFYEGRGEGNVIGSLIFTFNTLGGRNGYGAKLCNIFSTKFTVETACKDSKKTFKQVKENWTIFCFCFFKLREGGKYDFTANDLHRPGMTIWGEQRMLASGLLMERSTPASASDQIWPSLK